MPYRQSQWRTDITVHDPAGDVVLGPADKWEGGDKDSDTETYPRASGDVPLGGRPSREDGSATYLYDEPMHAVFKRLDRGAGQLSATITRTPQGDDGTPFAGGGFTLVGKLKGVQMPGGDYGSNDGAEAVLTFSLDPVLA